MKDKPAADPGSTADREFVHSRLIDAPRERVFRRIAEFVIEANEQNLDRLAAEVLDVT